MRSGRDTRGVIFVSPIPRLFPQTSAPTLPDGRRQQEGSRVPRQAAGGDRGDGGNADFIGRHRSDIKLAVVSPNAVPYSWSTEKHDSGGGKRNVAGVRTFVKTGPAAHPGMSAIGSNNPARTDQSFPSHTPSGCSPVTTVCQSRLTPAAAACSIMRRCNLVRRMPTPCPSGKLASTFIPELRKRMPRKG